MSFVSFLCACRDFTVYMEKKTNEPVELDFCAVARSKRTIAGIIYPDEDDDAHEPEQKF